MHNNRELYDGVAFSTREEGLRSSFFPVMYEWYEWKEDPTIFVPGTDFDRMLEELRAKYKVTPEEWAWLQKAYHEEPI